MTKGVPYWGDSRFDQTGMVLCHGDVRNAAVIVGDGGVAMMERTSLFYIEQDTLDVLSSNFTVGEKSSSSRSRVDWSPDVETRRWMLSLRIDFLFLHHLKRTTIPYSSCSFAGVILRPVCNSSSTFHTFCWRYRRDDIILKRKILIPLFCTSGHSSVRWWYERTNWSWYTNTGLS